MVVTLWNLTGISAALLPQCLSNFRTIGKVHTRISWLRDLMRSWDKTSVRLVKRGSRVYRCMGDFRERSLVSTNWTSLKCKCHHFDEIFVTDCTESCYFDNFWSSQWRQFHKNGNISVFSVLRTFTIRIVLNKNISILLVRSTVKVIHKGVKPFLNETVKKSCFHVDL